LLAFVAACDVLVCGSSVITFYNAVTASTPMGALLCAWEMLFAVFAFNMSLVLMFAIGLDRLFSVAFPIWYYK
jgi:hypothetical protein